MTYHETTKRQGIKWVKVTHTARNKYVVACGFKGNLKAFKVNSGSKAWSQIAADHWLEDQPGIGATVDA